MRRSTTRPTGKLAVKDVGVQCIRNSKPGMSTSTGGVYSVEITLTNACVMRLSIPLLTLVRPAIGKGQSVHGALSGKGNLSRSVISQVSAKDIAFNVDAILMTAKLTPASSMFITLAHSAGREEHGVHGAFDQSVTTVSAQELRTSHAKTR